MRNVLLAIGVTLVTVDMLGGFLAIWLGLSVYSVLEHKTPL